MKKPLYLITLFAASLLSTQLLHVPLAHATLTGFDAGNIIDDAVMTNKGIMSANQIQVFLNNQVPSCDTNGTQPATDFGRPDLTHAQYASLNGWPAPPYTCLKDFSENGLSSAQIIYNASQQYGINPQVLIVTIQKESSLVTDTWPLQSQYRTATGYGCPDTGPNNSANCNSNYYGFTNQVNWAAQLYHSVVTQDPNWYSPYIVGTNYIQWNPNAGCGGTNVNIANWSTAALYDYTPYQPNSASLAAGWGSGDSCSAYGNRNFYNYFTSWFGSTRIPTLFRINNTDPVYLKSGTDYFQFPSASVLYAYGYSFNQVANVQNAGSLTFQGNLACVVRFDGADPVYLMDNGILHQFPDLSTYNVYGYQLGNEVNLSSVLMGSVQENMSSIAQVAGNSPTYTITGGKKAHISTYSVYTTQGNPVYSTLPVVHLTSDYLNTLPNAQTIMPSAAVLQSSGGTIGYWNGTNLTEVSSAFTSNYATTPEFTLFQDSYDTLPKSATVLTNYISTPDGTSYIVDGGNKYPIDSATMNTLSGYGKTSQQVDAYVTNKLATSTLQPLVRLDNGDAVYQIKDARLWHIYSAADLTGLGYTWSNITPLQSNAKNVFTDTGNVALAQNRLVRINNGMKVYMSDSSYALHWIPSSDIFHQYGLDFNSVINVSDSQVSLYSTSSQNITPFVTDSQGTTWLFDNTKRWQIPSAINSDVVVGQPLANASAQLLLNNEQPSATQLTQYVRVGTSDTVYKISGGKVYDFTSADRFLQEATWNEVQSITQNTLNYYSYGGHVS